MTANELFEEAALNWKANKGIGTAFVPPPLNSKILVYQVLAKVYSKTPNANTVIIIEDFSDRIGLIEFLTNQEDEENNAEFKRLIKDKFIRILTRNFIVTGNWHSYGLLCIWYNPRVYSDMIAYFLDNCKFKLVILDKLLTNQSESAAIYKIAPLLECFKQTEINELRVSSPVEEMWIKVIIPPDSENYKLYEFYCKYIETSINIFGSFDMIQQARVGNETLNISATTICNQIAQENGWNEHLDMAYEFNRNLDEMYNPNNLRDRATKTYEIIRKRSNLVSDYEGKLEKILEIVKQCAGDKILIINKRGEFASKVTEYLNNNSETDICGNYHNKVDDIPAVDEDGKPVFIKSGPEKGKRKAMAYRAQMSLNERKFNAGKLSCLSMSNAPEKNLDVDFDTIIITSPLCEDIKSYLYRLSNISLKGDKIKLFSIFCKNTIEQQKLFNKPIGELHTIVNKDEIMVADENNFDFVIAD